MERKICNALFVWNQNETLIDPVLQLMDTLKEKLLGVEIGSVMEQDEYEDEDEVTRGCDVAIIFITPGFLRDLKSHLSIIIERFNYSHCYAFVVDDDKKEFVNFFKHAAKDLGGPGDADPHPDYSVSVNDVCLLIKPFIIPWAPHRCTFVYLEMPLPNIDHVVEAARKILNSTGFLFNQIDSNVYSQLKALDRKLLEDRLNIMRCEDDSNDDLIFFILVGCQCRCLDLATIAIVLFRLNITNGRPFRQKLIFKASNMINGDNDPLALRNAFIRCLYSDGSESEPIEELLSFHCDLSTVRPWLINLQDFDLFSKHQLALSQLKNFTDLFGKGSLVLVTTSGVPTAEIGMYENLVSINQGTTCNEPIKWRILRKSEIKTEKEPESSPMETQVERPTSRQLLRKEMATESIVEQKSGNMEKKQKITSI